MTPASCSRKRLLVPGAGSPSSNNLIRAFRRGDASAYIVGCHDDPFELKKSVADKNYLIPELSAAQFESALRGIVTEEQIDLVVPNYDDDVLAISKLAEHLPCRTYLPCRTAIDSCLDKYELATFLHSRGFHVPESYAVNDWEDIETIFRKLSSHRILWCRTRKGTGSLGALPVKNPQQARAWIEYWEQMRGIPPRSFVLAEYLPGRDFVVQCLFKRGKPIIAKMFQRLSYLTLNAVASGVSSTAALSKMVYEPRIMQMCIEAMLALDPDASCVFFADVKENAKGEACITEINPGRFSNLPTIQDSEAQDSMCLTYLHAAFDEALPEKDLSTYVQQCYVMRRVDGLPVVLNVSELFEGFTDFR
jgi:carbamoylphosphate synthase large subunit